MRHHHLMFRWQDFVQNVGKVFDVAGLGGVGEPMGWTPVVAAHPEYPARIETSHSLWAAG